MINLITAIGNTYLNEKIKNIKGYNIVFKDIQYSEGILEVLNINKNIKILLISTTILDENNFIEKIREKFKNIEIVLFIDKCFEKDIGYFNSKGIYKIYLNNKSGYEEFLKKLNRSHENIEEIVKQEMKDFKKEIIENQNNKNNFFSIKKEKNIFLLKDSVKKIITISGSRGVRKKYFFEYFF